MAGEPELNACAQVDQLMQKLDEQLQLLRQATPLLRQRAKQLTDAQAAEVREQLALVLDQQTDQFEESMTVMRQPCLSLEQIRTIFQQDRVSICMTHSSSSDVPCSWALTQALHALASCVLCVKPSKAERCCCGGCRRCETAFQSCNSLLGTLISQAWVGRPAFLPHPWTPAQRQQALARRRHGQR